MWNKERVSFPICPYIWIHLSIYLCTFFVSLDDWMISCPSFSYLLSPPSIIFWFAIDFWRMPYLYKRFVLFKCNIVSVLSIEMVMHVSVPDILWRNSFWCYESGITRWKDFAVCYDWQICDNGNMILLSKSYHLSASLSSTLFLTS